ncbi:hypothetical protein KM043_002588 [Ampulex compressa]|nr:hypothetical protein KM043_002588 [Ampulex compressa]
MSNEQPRPFEGTNLIWIRSRQRDPKECALLQRPSFFAHPTEEIRGPLFRVEASKHPEHRGSMGGVEPASVNLKKR